MCLLVKLLRISLPCFSEWGPTFPFTYCPLCHWVTVPIIQLCPLSFLSWLQKRLIYITTSHYIDWQAQGSCFTSLVGGSQRDQFIFLGLSAWIGRSSPRVIRPCGHPLTPRMWFVDAISKFSNPFATLTQFQWILPSSSLGGLKCRAVRVCLSPLRAQWSLLLIPTAQICPPCAEGLQLTLPLPRAFACSFPSGRNKMSLGKPGFTEKPDSIDRRQFRKKDVFVYTTHLGAGCLPGWNYGHGTVRQTQSPETEGGDILGW